MSLSCIVEPSSPHRRAASCKAVAAAISRQCRIWKRCPLLPHCCHPAQKLLKGLKLPLILLPQPAAPRLLPSQGCPSSPCPSQAL